MSFAAGWYADPSAPGRIRWWDGTTWTQTTADAPRAAAAPTPVAYGAAPERWNAVNLVVPAERTMATRALVWGILSIPLFMAFPVPMLAVIYGIIGVARAQRLRRYGEEPQGLARSVTGIVLGGIGGLLTILSYGAVYLYGLSSR